MMTTGASVTIGWVCDQATSQRRLHVEVLRVGHVQVTVEVYGQVASVIELDADGVVILQGLLGEAFRRTQADVGSVAP